MLSFSPRDVLDKILDLIESVSEGFPTYFYVNNILATGYSFVGLIRQIPPLMFGDTLNRLE